MQKNFNKFVGAGVEKSGVSMPKFNKLAKSLEYDFQLIKNLLQFKEKLEKLINSKKSLICEIKILLCKSLHLGFKPK